MSITAIVVPTGPYFAFTLTEMQAELERYKLARQQSGSRLLGASVNSESYQFGPRGDWNIDEWQMAIQAAFYYLDPGQYPFQPPTNQAVAALY